MTRFPHQLARHRADDDRQRRDDGFVLLESVVAISLITVIMTALATFFLNTIASTNQQRARQTATQVATSAVETIRGLHASDLVVGHDASSVASQFAAAAPAVAPWLATMTPATDPATPPPASGSGTSAAIPTIAVNQTVNNIGYAVNNYLGTCVITTAGPSTDCGLAAASIGITYLRAVVAVTWRDQRCAASTCAYVTATLLSAAADPVFNLNQIPPAVPIVTNPGSQTSAIGDTVALQLGVQNNTGVPTYTWQVTAGALPTGLALNPAGLISGVPTTQVSNKSVTVTVTDAFLRTASATFTWTILARLVITQPADQASALGGPITALTVTATGGSGAPYTWSDPTASLPPGLVLSTVSNQGKVTGTPTTAGTYSVQLTVKDATNTRTATTTFTWTVTYPPLAAANPGPQVSTLSTAVSLQLTVTGGSGSYAWSGGATLPAGLTITGGGLITGTPTTTGTVTVILTVTDIAAGAQQNMSFTWSVLDRPSVNSPANQITTVGAVINLALITSCPNSPCSYTLNNGPATLSISAAGVITGTITSAAQSFAGVTVTVRDNAGATATSGSFTVKVNAAPTLANPGNQTVLLNAPDSLDLSALLSGGTGPYTYSWSGLPSWLTLNTSTGLLSGTAPSAKATTSNITLGVRDSAGVTSTSATFKWNVTNLATSIANQTTFRSRAVSLDLDTLTTGGTSPYTYTITGKPSWLTLNGSTGVLSGTAPSASGATTGITVTVTDSVGAVIVSASFSWFVTDLKWNTIPTQGSTRGTPDSLSVTLYDSGGTAPYSYTATGLPTGLAINGATGVISGTPTVINVYTSKITVTDSTGASVTSSGFLWKVT